MKTHTVVSRQNTDINVWLTNTAGPSALRLGVERLCALVMSVGTLGPLRADACGGGRGQPERELRKASRVWIPKHLGSARTQNPQGVLTSYDATQGPSQQQRWPLSHNRALTQVVFCLAAAWASRQRAMAAWRCTSVGCEWWQSETSGSGLQSCQMRGAMSE